MRRLSSLAILAFLIPVAAEAQVPRIQFGGGLSSPSGDAATAYDMGWHVRGSIGLSFPLFPLTLRADGEYHSFPSAVTGVTDNTTLLAGTLNGMFDLFGLGALGTGAQLYAVAGGGYYSFGIASGLAGGDFSDPGIQGGIGTTIGALGFGGFVEAKFVNVFTSGSSFRYIPITAGIKF